MHVHDELVGEGSRTLVGEVGCRRFGAADTEQRAVDVVHRDERRRHPGGGAEERAPGQALVSGEPAAQFLDARLHRLLPRRLRQRHELVAGDELGGNRRGERRRFGGQQLFQILRIQR